MSCIMSNKYWCVKISYSADTKKELNQFENSLKKDGFRFIEEQGFYRYYKNILGLTAEIYMRF